MHPKSRFCSPIDLQGLFVYIRVLLYAGDNHLLPNEGYEVLLHLDQVGHICGDILSTAWLDAKAAVNASGLSHQGLLLLLLPADEDYFLVNWVSLANFLVIRGNVQ